LAFCEALDAQFIKESHYRWRRSWDRNQSAEAIHPARLLRQHSKRTENYRSASNFDKISSLWKLSDHHSGASCDRNATFGFSHSQGQIQR
jgi:hypothetical protein